MKLSQCQYGAMVIDNNLNVGHVVGVAYNINIRHTGGMSDQDLLDRTIPLVQFADGTRGVHHSNLKLFKD